MNYIRAVDVLPQELIEQLQQYVDGAMLYIPKKEDEKGRGGQTAAKAALAKRNARIYTEFIEGSSAQSLAEKYFLAKKSIERIIRREKLKRINEK